MHKIVLLLAVAAPLGLAACVDTPGNRALGGAVAGAAVADLTDNSAVTGAVIGGLAGAASCTLPNQGC